MALWKQPSEKVWSLHDAPTSVLHNMSLQFCRIQRKGVLAWCTKLMCTTELPPVLFPLCPWTSRIRVQMQGVLTVIYCNAAGIAEEQGSGEDYDPNDPYEEAEYLTDDSIDPDEMTYEVSAIPHHLRMEGRPGCQSYACCPIAQQSFIWMQP